MARKIASETSIKGLKELQTKLHRLLPTDPTLLKDINVLVADMSTVTRDLMRASVRRAGWPEYTKATGSTSREPIEKWIFKTGDVDAAISSFHNKNVFTALAGISKGHQKRAHPMYREWGKRAGHIVGMGWSTMLEFGTKRMAARPAIRPAILEAKRVVVQRATERYKQMFGITS